MTWLSIKEHTPPCGRPIQVSIAGDEYWPTVAELSGQYWRIPGTNRVLLEHPTHWKELDEPPAEHR